MIWAAGWVLRGRGVRGARPPAHDAIAACRAAGDLGEHDRYGTEATEAQLRKLADGAYIDQAETVIYAMGIAPLAPDAAPPADR